MHVSSRVQRPASSISPHIAFIFFRAQNKPCRSYIQPSKQVKGPKHVRRADALGSATQQGGARNMFGLQYCYTGSGGSRPGSPVLIFPHY